MVDPEGISQPQFSPCLVLPRNGRQEDISILSGWDRWRSLRGSRVQFRGGILAKKRAGYSNFRELTRGALTAGRRGSDINIALPKRNTLSRGKFPSEDQRSKLLKSFSGALLTPWTLVSCDVRMNFSNKKKREQETDQKSLYKIKARRCDASFRI